MPDDSFNAVYLENWLGQPVHCPFCGTAHDPQEGSGVVDCRHWLYTQYQEFLDRSDRYNLAIGFPAEYLEADLSQDVEQEFGRANEIVERNRGSFFNLVEYQIDTVSDITRIGFAPVDEELDYWGQNGISP